MSEAHQLLKDYLAQEAARGVTHVSLNHEARSALYPAKPKTVVAPVVSKPVTFVETKPQSIAETFEKRPIPVAVVAEPEPEIIAETSELSRKEELARISLQAENSERARAMGTLRDIMVFATGNPEAEIMFIGEAPGAEEEKLREPFVGPAGQTLTKIIQAMGLRRSDVYISNICKYRPLIDDGRPQNSRNRAPTAAEMGSCLPYIVGEIQIIKPKVIVALGSTAATGLGIEGTVGKLRGRFTPFREIPVMVTYHPSYLLRKEQDDGGGVAEKRLVWEDMMQVMEFVGIPVSAKQRAYFTKSR